MKYVRKFNVLSINGIKGFRSWLIDLMGYDVQKWAILYFHGSSKFCWSEVFNFLKIFTQRISRKSSFTRFSIYCTIMDQNNKSKNCVTQRYFLVHTCIVDGIWRTFMNSLRFQNFLIQISVVGQDGIRFQ